MGKHYFADASPINIRIPTDMLKKVKLIRTLYQDSVSVYIVSLIEADLKQNAEKYQEIINKTF